MIFSRLIEIAQSVETLQNPVTSAEEMLHTILSTNFTVEKIVSRETTVGILIAEIKSPSHVHVVDFHIHPDAQHKGFGKAALAEFLVRHKAMQRIDLLTHEENRKALSLYEMFGFKRERIIPNAYGNGEDFVLLSIMAI